MMMEKLHSGSNCIFAISLAKSLGAQLNSRANLIGALKIQMDAWAQGSQISTRNPPEVWF